MPLPVFANPVANPFGLGPVASNATPTFADIDNDGDFDAFVGDAEGAVHFFLNSGTASAPAFASQGNGFGLGGLGYRAAPTVVDIDGDGRLDAVLGIYNDIRLYLNTGSASAPAFALQPRSEALFFPAYMDGSCKPAFVDIDADGDLDLFVGEQLGIIRVVLNAGTASAPAFTALSPIAPFSERFGLLINGQAEAAPTFIDVDHDRDFDVFVGHADGEVVFFLNTGSASNPAFSVGTSNFGLSDVGTYATPSFTDIDDDGDLDAFIGNSSGNVQFFENVAPSNTAPVPGTPGSLSFADTRFNDSFAPANGTVTATDVDNDPLSFDLVGGIDNGNGSVSLASDYGVLTLIKATGAISFLPDDAAIEALGTAASVMFLVTVSDGIAAPVEQSVTISIAQSGTTETAGNDVLTGTTGNDVFNSLAGNDRLEGLGGNDTMNGGTGADTLIGGLGNDSYFVDSAGDVVTEAANGGTDTVFSALASYTLKAFVEIGRVDGSGNFNLSGNLLANSLFGGTGRNLLTGGLGADKLTGGTGADRFDFNLTTESGITATTRDQVLDFSHSQGDKLDLSGIDASLLKAGNQAFTKLVSSNTAFSTSKSFTAAGQLYYDQKADVLYGNVDADAAPEFSIKVMGPASLVVGDFIL